MAEHNDTGMRGERMARKFLEEKGYEILDENWTAGKSEVDIVAFKDGVIIFVEVKTRTSANYGQPESFVTSAKMEQLARAAEEYVEIMEHIGEIRFDVISVLFNAQNRYEITHFVDAFWPDGHQTD